MPSEIGAVHRLPQPLVDGIERLDPNQRAALATPGNLVVVAGPGSGKTRAIVARAGYLLSTHISPLRGLAAITYTNQAADELREGLAALGVVEPRRVFTGTLHSFCLSHVLRYAPLVGVELPDLRTLMTSAEVRNLQQECADDVHTDVWALRDVFTSLRRRLAAGEDVSDHRADHVLAIRRYEAKCQQHRIWDFDGVVLAAVALLRDHLDIADVVKAKFPVVLIDEYQDLGAGLHRLVEALLDAGVEITAVGDADQSIFGFAGGDPKYLDALCRRDDFAVARLSINYRSGSAVVAAAESALDQARGWQADPARADPGTLEFQIVEGTQRQQARAAADAVLALLAASVPPHEIGVLVRYRNPMAPLIQEYLTADGVNVRFDGDATAPSTELGKWLEAAALYASRLAAADQKPEPPPSGVERLLDRLDGMEKQAGRIRDPAPRVARIASLHSALLGRRSTPDVPVQVWSQRIDRELGLTQLASAIGDPRATDELGALLAASEDILLADLASDSASTGKVVVTTYHGAKGRTFTSVVLPGLTEGVVPPWGGTPWSPVPLQGTKLAEERRGFYVALTRSRGSVLLQLSSSGVDGRRREFRHGYSSFAVNVAAAMGHPLSAS